MIVYIEGPRNCGKTYLLNDYFSKNKDNKSIHYYKFYFADHFKTLDLKWIEDSPALHYFSLGNIMTIMEMDKRGELKTDIVFDRAIISAYTWAVLRKRITMAKAKEEMLKLVSSDLFCNAKTIVIEHNKLGLEGRIKDAWDGSSNLEEWKVMQELIEVARPHLIDGNKRNSLTWFKNEFTDESKNIFALQIDTRKAI